MRLVDRVECFFFGHRWRHLTSMDAIELYEYAALGHDEDELSELFNDADKVYCDRYCSSCGKEDLKATNFLRSISSRLNRKADYLKSPQETLSSYLLSSRSH